MHMTRFAARFTPFVIALAILQACSFSDSSVSISESVGSSSESSASSLTSSGSSASSEAAGLSKEKKAYRDDVANLTYSVSGSSMTARDFPNALARTASQFKISNWSQEKATFYGIGKGLKRAGVAKENITRQPFLSNVLTANKNALSYIESGYSH